MYLQNMIITLILFGVASTRQDVDWQFIRVITPIGIALGVPVGLLIRSRLLRLFVFGPPQYGGANEAEELSDSLRPLLRLIGGLPLRLVGLTGVLTSMMVLACCWWFQKLDESLVTIYAIYY